MSWKKLGWLALICLMVPMFASYFFDDCFSTLSQIFQHPETLELGWDSADYGFYAGGYSFLCVCGGLIVCGILLDVFGVRIVGSIFVGLMALGALTVVLALRSGLEPRTSLLIAYAGCMIFGLGSEIAGVAVTRSIAKWFKGKEMALAMGLEMAIARLGVFGVMWIAPMVSKAFNHSIVAPVSFCAALTLIGLLFYCVFCVMDVRLDKQHIAAGDKVELDPEDEFKVSDLGKIFSSKMFWIVALMCVLYYSAIFPFQRYATNYLEVTLNIEAAAAARLFSCFPILAMVLTPFLGAFLDFKGKGASMLMIGSIIMIACHLSFAFLLPAFPSKALALTLIVVLGVSFSLVPAALWPSVPKIIDEKVLGSAYCLIFWVQNVGLCLVPLLIGYVLKATGGYLAPMIIFSSFGVLAFFLTFLLKVEDKKKGYGLELPNVKN